MATEEVETDKINKKEQGISIFEHLEHAFPLLKQSHIQQKLLQWNLNDSLQIHRFFVRKKLSPEYDKQIISDLFNDPYIQKLLSISYMDTNNSAFNPGTLFIEKLQVSITTMSFFDKLRDTNLVSANGYIRRCMDDVFDGYTVSDYLRDFLVNPDSENIDLLTSIEKNEFIFHLFKALVIGGSLTQSDDTIESYETIVKDFYKAFLSVRKWQSATGPSIEITSRVYTVGHETFKIPRYSSIYVVVDQRKSWVTVWYNPFQAYW